MKTSLATIIWTMIAAPLLVFMLGAPQPAFAQSEPFLGQLMVTAGNFCPRGWARTDGQLLPINQNTALFSILGTTYGGNGQTTFALPDLRGRGPIHNGQGTGLSNYLQGQLGGAESFTIQIGNMPAHNHQVKATNAPADQGGPATKYLASDSNVSKYQAGPPNKLMAADMITSTGGSQPVGHRSPYLTLMWCIAVQGVFPPRD